VGAGDLAARIELTGADEFTELAESFNQMAASLARQQEALVRSQKLASIGQVAARMRVRSATGASKSKRDHRWLCRATQASCAR
jgi:methyl-accepting chemotaxis protein